MIEVRVFSSQSELLGVEEFATEREATAWYRKEFARVHQLSNLGKSVYPRDAETNEAGEIGFFGVAWLGIDADSGEPINPTIQGAG